MSTSQPERPTTGITPFLAISGGRAHEALDFYQRAFAAVEMERNSTPDGKRLMQASLRLNNGWIMIADDFPEHGFIAPPPESVTLHLAVDDADAWYARAVEAGCTVRMEIADQFWGDRYAIVKDPFGHTWSMSTPIRR